MAIGAGTDEARAEHQRSHEAWSRLWPREFAWHGYREACRDQLHQSAVGHVCVCAIHMHAAGFCAQVKLKFSEPALGVFACNADACSSGSGCKTAHGPPDPQGSMFLKAMLCGGQVITICTLM